MSVPPPRSDRRTRGTLALLLGATLWAALGGAAPVAAQPVLVIDSITHSPGFGGRRFGPPTSTTPSV